MASPLKKGAVGLGGGICSATAATKHMADACAGEMLLHPSATQLTSPPASSSFILGQVPTAAEIDGTAGTRQRWRRRWRR